MNRRISINNIKKVIEFHYFKALSFRSIALLLKISSIKVSEFVNSFINSGLSFEEICQLPEKDFYKQFGYKNKELMNNNKYNHLVLQFPEIFKQ